MSAGRRDSERLRAPAGTGTFLTAARRARELEQLADGKLVDVLVVGGGVTGAGVALDAASRGLSVALIERRDLANGTSRFSSKLVHGGLRYLASLGFDVAWESARERATLAGVTAPHMVRALPQLTPVYGRYPGAASLAVEAGIRAGDAMRSLAGTSRRRLPVARRVGAEEVRLWAPAARLEGLRGAILAWDGQLEDDARLVVALARTAAAYGARICTYCEAIALCSSGAEVRDAVSGQRFHLAARHVVNATGVWAAGLIADIDLRPSKGAHLLVPAERLGNPRAMLSVPLPGHFGRFVFAIPRSDSLVLVGLTDEPHSGPIPDAPPVSAEEERFLLEAVSTALEWPLQSADVVGRYAGLRPLLAAYGETADLSRRHAVLEDEATGAITVVGGKLTTYRKMAQDAVDLIAARGGVRAGPCRTARLPLVGAPVRGRGVPPGVPPRLWRRFGTESFELLELAYEHPELLEPIVPGVPALRLELAAALEREGSLCAEDVIERRMRLGLVDGWRRAAMVAAEQALDGMDLSPVQPTAPALASAGRTAPWD